MKSRCSKERRRVLRLIGRAAGLAAVSEAIGLVGCENGPEPLPMPLSEFPEGRRVRVVWADRPVEVIRSGSDATARSLACTHRECEVTWEARPGRYVCPCHGGVFDADGRPVAGPPVEPLAAIPVRVRGDLLVVGG